MVAASAITPTLISGKAKVACSAATMISVEIMISKPPPQAIPLIAPIIGLFI